MTVQELLAQLQELAAEHPDIANWKFVCVERIEAEPPMPEGLTTDEEWKEVVLWI